MRCWRSDGGGAPTGEVDERMVDGLLDARQRATHGLLAATYVESVRSSRFTRSRMQHGRVGEPSNARRDRDRRIPRPDSGRIPMSQGEIRAPARHRVSR
jgi:hypothetical protein